MNKFSEQLKQLRLEKNFSQDYLAEQLFISRQAISKWENNEACPDMTNLIKLATIFEVSLDQLILGKSPGLIVERIVEKEPLDIKLVIRNFWLIFGNILIALFMLYTIFLFLDFLGIAPQILRQLFS
ncbi:helix-turn-helix domain-containing protein [Streptococcus hongkongensis]